MKRVLFVSLVFVIALAACSDDASKGGDGFGPMDTGDGDVSGGPDVSDVGVDAPDENADMPDESDADDASFVDAADAADANDSDAGCEPIDSSEFDEYECSPLCQTGCPDGQACYFGSNPTVGLTATCATPSSAGDGEPCDLNSDGLCAAGLNCTGFDGGTACFPICELGVEGQCGEDRECVGNEVVGTCQPPATM